MSNVISLEEYGKNMGRIYDMRIKLNVDMGVNRSHYNRPIVFIL